MLATVDTSIQVKEKPLKYGLKGIYKNGRIIIHDKLTNTEKACILAEELGHHYTSTGNIIDQSVMENRKQERVAREWAHKRLVPLTRIVEASKAGIRNRYELAGFLGVTEEFLEEALERYHGKYGAFVEHGEFIICFEPLGVLSKV
jgi:hypothetical protein